ncbi:putative RNA-dependent RNA polymerase 1 [Tasmannia lanceolata]|uniref:putative RNA-dependent RNA polymerase 1 n=1 Tax=Tasmannia lanceolata TaxID=3420 RepID=UPI004062E27F
MGSRTIQLFGFSCINATAEGIKDFLEVHTGEGTVYVIKVRLPNSIGPGSRAEALVQFTTSLSAEYIFRKAKSRKLRYESSNLTARKMERDIVPSPIFTMKHTILHFGYQVLEDKFSVLWNASDVEVKFEFGLRKLCFFLSYCGVEYKLEFFRDSISQIQLHCPHGHSKKFLMLQVQSAPRIYKKPQSNSLGQVYEDASFNYFRDIPYDQWVRATDFTPSCSIGQSFALCLEVPHMCDLPDIHEYFFYYKENEGQFFLERGYSFSRSFDLVPIVEPRQQIQLPYKILFKINSLVQHGVLIGPTLDEEFFRLVDPRSISIPYIEHALEVLSNLKYSCFEPAKWLSEKYSEYQTSKYLTKSTAISLETGLVYVHRVQVTPSKVYFSGPEVNISNRVLRNYSEFIDNFLRVSFVDEEWGKMQSTNLSRRTISQDGEEHTDIYKRIISTLRNGIVIGDRKFDFLAFSSSQLRENSAWMFAPREGITAADIRKWMGDFSEIRNVAKYAARLGQSFGSSKETLNVHRNEMETIPDVEINVNGNNYVFSDGIGKISADFARRIAIECDFKNSTPSAFQIRYGGYKGVVAVDPQSTFKFSLRKSMCKYKSENTKLDVLGWSKYQPCFLNRQLITLLSTLGIEDHIFEMKQKELVEQMDMILTDQVKAREVLEIMSPGENTKILKEMLRCGYKPDAEPFLSMMLQTFRASKLLDLRTKARIFVPDGRALMGCLDETRTLEYGQVFVHVSCVGGKESDKGLFVVEGKVVVAKNPCLHPGDVRILVAVNVPALHHMVDCVVFPQQGKRPHPNECSGSDLDGDIYFVSWDPELIPHRQIPPMEYAAAPTELLDHDVSIEEVEEYFANYMVNDNVGIISDAHTVFADKLSQKAESNVCVELAKLFAVAVDSPKTGVHAEIPPHLHVKNYPDFMEKLNKRTYESKRVIGKLFRAVKDIAPQTSHIKSFTREVAMQSYDSDMEVDGFEKYLGDAYSYKYQYDFKLGRLMEQYGIETEAEAFSGSIMKVSKLFWKRKDNNEVIGLAMRSLKKEVRAWFTEKCSESEPDVDGDVYAKASAWYHVTYHPDYWGRYTEGMDRDHFISFPWCISEMLIHIKQKKGTLRKAALE